MESSTGSNGLGSRIKQELPAIPQTAIRVITNPAGFYRDMPKGGGYLSPLVFMAVLGMAGAVVQFLLSLVGLADGGILAGMAAIVLTPILAAIFGFIGAAIVFAIWKILGSGENFETAYRCGAFTAAILPVTAVLSPIPYLGGIIGILWTTYLLVVASTEVHRIPFKKAGIVFGIIGAIFLISSLGAEIAGRKVAGSMEKWQQDSEASLENLEEMSPEEAGKLVGDFLKGFNQAAEEE